MGTAGTRGEIVLVAGIPLVVAPALDRRSDTVVLEARGPRRVFASGRLHMDAPRG